MRSMRVACARIHGRSICERRGGYFIVKTAGVTGGVRVAILILRIQKLVRLSILVSGLLPTGTAEDGLALSPAAFRYRTATAASTTQINLQWTDNSTNEQGFEIERCSGSGCLNFGPVRTMGANATS